MRNYTPITVVVVSDNKEIVYPPSGLQAQVKMIPHIKPPLENGTPVITVEYGEAVLPQDEEFKGECIVTTMFADAYRRQNGENGVTLYVPDSGPTAIREHGQIKAVRALIKR